MASKKGQTVKRSEPEDPAKKVARGKKKAAEAKEKDRERNKKIKEGGQKKSGS